MAEAVKCNGMEELRRKLSGLDAAAAKAYEPAMEQVAMIVERRARLNCSPGTSPYESMIFPTKTKTITVRKRKTSHTYLGQSIASMQLPVGSTYTVQLSGVPVDTGLMRASIASEVLKTSYGAGSVALKAVIRCNVDYAKYVHDGTSKMQARPFLTDAIATELANIKKVLAKVEVKTNG
jgi:HK97 gp10 family phage protein